MERKGLGRGLDALIPADAQGVRERVQSLKVSQIQEKITGYYRYR